MKIFLDANVLVAVLNKEYPVFTWSSRILSLKPATGFTLYTSPICLAIAFYFSEKKSGRTAARQKMALLSRHIAVAAVDQQVVSEASGDKRVSDFEDGLEYYAALKAGCRCIITGDRDDFYFADIEVLTPQSFLEKYFPAR